jgi:hypothetical protein
LIFSSGAYLSKTLASAGNQKTFTLSFWMKATDVTGTEPIIGTGTSSTNYNNFSLVDGALTYKFNAGTLYTATSNSFLRDPSAWYHVVLTIDMTQATAANRVKFYVNGALIPNTAGSTYPPQNTNQLINDTNVTTIGSYYDYVSSAYIYNLNSIFAEFNFIDNAALSASSFGYSTATYNQWQPIKYTGSYGTTGYYLTFATGQASGYGTDNSGLGNNWTSINSSSMTPSTDSPVVGVADGKIYGNFANWGNFSATGLPSITIRLGNTYTATTTSGGGGNTIATVTSSISTGKTGKYYIEFTIGSVSGTGRIYIGVASSSFGYYKSDGAIVNLSGSTVATGATYTTADVIGMVVDINGGNVYFYKNNTLQGSFSFTANTSLYVRKQDQYLAGTFYSVVTTANFGQYTYVYTPSEVGTPLCAYTKPLYGITVPNRYFDALLYTGDGTVSREVLQNGNFTPNFFWLKRRDVAVGNHFLFDTVRGAGSTSLKTIYSNLTNTQDDTLGTAGNASAFTGTGLTLAKGSATNDNLNASASKYVAWTWKESPSAGFDIVTYVGNGTSQAISHNLGVSPDMIIVKRLTTTAANWAVYSSSISSVVAPEQAYLILNTTANPTTDTTVWNNTSPTTTTFTIGSNAIVNANLSDYVAYVFAETPGFSQFGAYTGTGDNLTGALVFCDFTPKYILIKAITSTARNWYVLDSARNTYNVLGEELYPDATAVGATAVDVDFLCNGFKIRGTNVGINTSTVVYTYMAFAENPFNYTNAR